MKDKILPFIIGLLVGAIITTAGFWIYNKINSNDTNQTTNENNQMGQPPEMPNGEQPPEKPNGDDGNEPPEKPDN